MNRELFAQVSEIFLEARALSEQARASLLDLRCGGRADLREAVEELLREDGHRSDGLDDSAMAEGMHLDAFQGLFTAGGSRHASADIPAPVLPEVVGRYRIVRKLGEGGMGIVCEAEQDNPRRSVAIKLLKLGVGSAALLRRFTHEAHILARLQHPGIARVYDAGTLELAGGSQAYFAMELITGRPLLEHAAEAKLGTRERLLLFVAICEAVEYAHQKGVIHRDLKPSNIMVDEHGSPRVLDFGVARVTDADIQATTLHTNPGQLVGTLPYMSPEQIGGDIGAVDTRSDVYALGVVLFQLLSGRLPLDTRSRTIADAARIIRDQEPTRLGSLDTAFRGDLETIVARALEKEAKQRYQSASAIADDVKRFLNFEPIQARPPTRMYQIRKFTKRHPELVLGLGVAAAAVLLGLVGTTWGLMRASAQRDLARSQALVADQQKAGAQREATRSARLAAALQRILDATNPTSPSGYNDGPVQVLAQAANEIGSDLDGEPESEWTVRIALASAFRGLGAFPNQVSNLRRADELCQQLFDEGDPRRLDTTRALSTAYTDYVTHGMSPSNVPPLAMSHTVNALKAARRVLGEDHPTTLALMDNEAYLVIYQSNAAKGAALHKELIAKLRGLLPESRPCSLAFALTRLAFCLGSIHDQDGARTAADEAMDIVNRELEPGDNNTLVRQLGLPDYMLEAGRIPEAIRLVRMHLDRIERSRGTAHPSALDSTLKLAHLYFQVGDFRTALELENEAIANSRALKGRWAPDMVPRLIHQAHLFGYVNRIDQSEAAWAEILAILKRNSTPTNESLRAEYWRSAALVCGLRSHGTWASECLRSESLYALDGAMAASPSKTLEPSDVRWGEFTFSLHPTSGPGQPVEGSLESLWATSDPPPGLYTMMWAVPIQDRVRTVQDSVLVAPWVVRKFGARFHDMRSYEQWATRTSSPADEEVHSTALTSLGWHGLGFGPNGRDNNFGIIAETTVDLAAGSYEFALEADDAGILFVDGQKLIDTWPDTNHRTNTIVRQPLTSGPHAIRVEYLQYGNMSRLRLRVKRMGGPEAR